MASIHKRKKSRFWTASYTSRDGRQLKKSTKTTDKNQAYEIAFGYLSEFGDYHAEAVNAVLQKAAPLDAVDAHSYSHWWYTNSIQNAGFTSTLGFRESFAYYLFSGEGTGAFPPSIFPAGVTYHQVPDSDNILDLELLPDWNPSENVPILLTSAYHLNTTPQYVVNGTVAPGWNEGQVTLQSGQYTAISVDQGMNSVGFGNLQTLDLVNLPDFQAILQNGPPLNVVNNNARGVHANGLPPDETASNSPAYLWLPIFVPSDVKAMAFDFTISGDGNNDSLAFGINNTNLFSLESQFIADDTPSKSPLIDISAYAGQTNVFFFGIVGGTSTNCAVQIEGVRFYTLAPPQLTITQTGDQMLIAWPSSASGYSVQTTTNLADPNSWMTLTNVPAIVNLQNTITNPIVGSQSFYRLIQSQ